MLIFADYACGTRGRCVPEGDGLPFVKVRPLGTGACLPRRYAHTHAHTHTHTHTHLSYPMYSLPLIGHVTPQKGGSKTRVQLLGRLRLFSWAIADWSSCLTPLCKDGSYDGKFTGRGASSLQGKSSRDALSGAIGRRPGLWLLGVLGNSGSCPTRLPRSKCDASRAESRRWSTVSVNCPSFQSPRWCGG